MFRVLGNVIARRPWALLAVWAALLAAVQALAPAWQLVTREGDFGFLPDDVPSRQAEQFYARAFSRDRLGSNVVIVARRVNSPLQRRDWGFLEQVLQPRLRALTEEINHGATVANQDEAPPIVRNLRTAGDGPIGQLLSSADRHGTLVVMELSTEFMSAANGEIIDRIQHLIRELHEEHATGQRVPPGLHLTLTGTATAGRDMLAASRHSASHVTLWTVLIVGTLLLAVERAPLLAAIPLAAAALAAHVSLGLLALMAQLGITGVFAEIDAYTTVLAYAVGAALGIIVADRYREELDRGATFPEAIAQAVRRSGAALSASAAAALCGAGVLALADYGKFRQAGVALTLALTLVFVAAATLVPALLVVARQWAFWPRVRRERIPVAPGWVSPASLMSRVASQRWGHRLSESLRHQVLQRPGALIAGTLLLLLPMALTGAARHADVSYGVFGELPHETTSRTGASALRDHFPAGEIGPLTLLIHAPHLDFHASRGDGPQPDWTASVEGIETIEELTLRLAEHRDELRIADIRSLSHPLGLTQPSVFENAIGRIPLWTARAFEHYVGDGEFGPHVTRLQLLLTDDPLARDSIRQLERLEELIPQVLPETLDDAQLYWLGPTASIRDLRVVTHRDHITVAAAALAGLAVVMLLLVRSAPIAGWLLMTALLSYLVALGLTATTFRLWGGAAFEGLDWKVPVLLFAILMAVGQDYNLLLMARIREEQGRCGPLGGVLAGLMRTGRSLSAGGLVMAGGALALLSASLVGMQQLGVALAFGWLVNAFVVRPILAPAWLVLLYSGRFRSLGRLLAAQSEPPNDAPRPVGVGGIPD